MWQASKQAFKLAFGLLESLDRRSSGLKTYSTGYFSKQQNETGYFYGMTTLPLVSPSLDQKDRSFIDYNRIRLVFFMDGWEGDLLQS